MALIKEIESPEGFSTNYHNIGFWELNKTDGNLRVRICSYLSREKRDEGKRWACFEHVDIPDDIWRPVYAEGGNLAQAVYGYLLTIDKYKGANSDEN